MKVWQCLALAGLCLAVPVAEAQETSAPPQESSQSSQAPAADEGSSQQNASAPQGAAQNQPASTGQEAPPAPREDWTPQALFDRVIERARTLAGQEYSKPQSQLPDALKNLAYDDYRNIHFRKEHALWRDDRLFEVQFFHPGFLYDVPVEMHVLKGGRIEDIGFEASMFDYEDSASAVKEVVEKTDPAKLGFAGFRLHYPVNTPDYKDEIAVFLGASYFRLVGRGQGYGLSARGLAVDTATQGGEEFPAFRAFWLVRPEPNASDMILFALLDSPSVTGAYRFDIHAGANTVVDVDARLFARQEVGKLGVAPLTSMFLHGENSQGDYDDYRPEVHDSDGLLMHTSTGQWIWRPLSNPPSLNVTQLRDTDPLGFGLMQRDRDFEHYLDMDAGYQRRPSLWVRPDEGDWGQGGVELVEIPTDKEIHDNIITYWVPDKPFKAGESRRYQYRLSTHDGAVPDESLGRAVRMRNGWGADPGQKNPPSHGLRRFVVDFRGDALAGLDASQPVKAELNVSHGKVNDLQVRRLPDGKTWRASFKLDPQGESADMQLELKLRGQRLTETWSYLWNPDVL
ncbi:MULTISPECIES: glucan biosynthesis protein [Modicisalibacter]|uniref:glucan biosynthesis protein n=1 Tax=Modicisalibacter TaxID=574347 RepID=UPI00100B0A71|nr:MULTISPECIES: glucan biosynthesis protein [Halomonadaceae]MBZ9557725.1 glucan biosynthesis protein [Modicisalibacter sp. R2A 31.J]MBZ9573611.1 glucan biosynthesis protein [Modicisalibacter sp. MOD 31.J]